MPLGAPGARLQQADRQTAGLHFYGAKQDDRLDGIALRKALGAGDHVAETRRDEDTLPGAILAGAHGSSRGRGNLGAIEAALSQVPVDLLVGLLEKAEQQVLDTQVVMIVVAALLFGGPENAARSRAESGEYRQSYIAHDGEKKMNVDGRGGRI